MASRNCVYGFAVLAVLILCTQVTVVAGEICGSGLKTKICDYGCCLDDCCPGIDISKLSTGVIVGIAVGCVVILVLIVVSIVACCMCCIGTAAAASRPAPQPVIMHPVAAHQQPGVTAPPAYYSAQPQPGVVNPGYKY